MCVYACVCVCTCAFYHRCSQQSENQWTYLRCATRAQTTPSFSRLNKKKRKTLKKKKRNQRGPPPIIFSFFLKRYTFVFSSLVQTLRQSVALSCSSEMLVGLDLLVPWLAADREKGYRGERNRRAIEERERESNRGERERALEDRERERERELIPC